MKQRFWKKPLKSRYRWKNNGKGQGLLIHKVVAEKALGRPLPEKAQVHHVDNDGHNNDPSNLVICPDDAYHKLLHVRTKALEKCGNANWIHCVRCGEYDDPKNLYLYTPKDQKSPRGEHRSCHSKYQHSRERRN